MFSDKLGGGDSGSAWNQNGESAWSGGGSCGTSYAGGSGGGISYGEKAGRNGSPGGPGGLGALSDTSGAGIWDQYKASGTGGLMIVYADAVDNTNGRIKSDRTNGRRYSGNLARGGSSGGGSVNIFYEKQINKGDIYAGNGCVTIGSISTGKFISD